MEIVSVEHLDMLRHMLGINDPAKRRPEPYRNYAAVEPGNPRFLAMEAAGLVERYKQAGPVSPYDYYRCTETGRLAAMRSFRGIQYNPKRRRYLAFLDLRDCRPDVTFREFLTESEYAEARRV